MLGEFFVKILTGNFIELLPQGFLSHLTHTFFPGNKTKSAIPLVATPVI